MDIDQTATHDYFWKAVNWSPPPSPPPTSNLKAPFRRLGRCPRPRLGADPLKLITDVFNVTFYMARAKFSAKFSAGAPWVACGPASARSCYRVQRLMHVFHTSRADPRPERQGCQNVPKVAFFAINLTFFQKMPIFFGSSIMVP